MEDISLANSDILAPSVSEKINIQLKVTYKNCSPNAITPQIYLIVDNEGIFNIRDGLGLAQIGILSKQDVLTARSKPGIDYEDVLDVYGGDFFSDVSSFMKKLPQNIGKAVEWSKDNLLPIAQAVAPLLMGLGEGEDYNGGALLDGGLMVGGRKMQRRQLRDRARRR